jgi:hypothetical protein
MYEAPKLTRVGKAQDVVLGVASLGGDLDAMWDVQNLEFAEETEEEGA